MSDASDVSDASDDGSSSDEQIEWNVTQRSRRATAGNRLSTLLTQEAPEDDDDVQLLFKENEEEPDEEFEAKESDDEGAAGGGDSSSSSEDEDEGADELAGEKQLEREERAKKKQQKRKADQAFMRPRASKPKRVKIADPDPASTPGADPTDADAHCAARAAELKRKKKSDRVSWLLDTDGHAATRTSSRTLSRQNKERTQASLKESEAKRKRQLAVMEAAHKRRQAQKGKPLTQEDRLREAARTEEINSQSLNRWEEMERDRLERQRAKLEALQNRKLEGPFIRWWSGRAEWEDGKLIHVGRRPAVEEVEEGEAEEEAPQAQQDVDQAAAVEPTHESKPTNADLTSSNAATSPKGTAEDQNAISLAEDLHASNDADRVQLSAEDAVAGSAAQATETNEDAAESGEDALGGHESKGGPDFTEEKPDTLSVPSGQDNAPSADDQVDQEQQSAPQESEKNTERQENKHAEPMQQESSLQERGFLDGIDQYAAMHDGKDEAHVQPREGISAAEASPQTDAPATESQPTDAPKQEPEDTVAGASAPKETTYSARQYIQLMNFSPTAAQSWDTHRRVLFNWRSAQLAKPTKPAPQLCAITAQPARYRDPATGLAYRDSVALKRIKRITMREGPRWSQALGAWIGDEVAALGVPAGFIESKDDGPNGPNGSSQVDEAQNVKIEANAGETVTSDAV